MTDEIDKMIEAANLVEAPGSETALKKGCKCPVIDNSRGVGYMIPGQYVINGTCPLHGKSCP